VRETRVFVFVERVLEGEEYRVLSDEWGGAVQTGHNLKSREDNINRVRHTVNPAGVSVCACPRQVRGKSEKKLLRRKGPTRFL
jgi:hypothetical protein